MSHFFPYFLKRYSSKERCGILNISDAGGVSYDGVTLSCITFLIPGSECNLSVVALMNYPLVGLMIHRRENLKVAGSLGIT